MPITSRTIAGRAVNPIGLGCMSLSWAYGTPPSDEDGAKLLERALDLGYNNLDTARIYGLGHNETLIGKTLAARRNEFFLASKTGIIVDGDKRRIDCRPETIRAALDESLRLLNTERIDLYYLHRRDFTVPIEESIGALADLVASGKIGSIGLSEMSAETLRKADAVHPIAAMQTEYSLMTRNPEIAVLDVCRELGTTFVAFSPVGRGALAGGVRDAGALGAKDIRRSMPRFGGENWAANRELLDRFEAIAAREGVTPAQLSLAWVLSRGDHVVTIPGTANIAHLEENIARWDWELPAAVSAELDSLINRETVAGGRYAEAMQRTIDTEEFA
ncbi:aldo/keto reductase [Novosphingobium sp. Gsoil 351]|uniref:aldo/keto reductase n=1 Tax=Novosphingobium sp. Gsoil 351 TaxID=2675225 RepID=UPI0012B4FAC8|nr:aldo/keto reductase [Novosphingobium sp. Gsoil 351]QGN54816.1 aldo/keto reductase [Novosphingobium sp. Gsoil 351]